MDNKKLKKQIYDIWAEHEPYIRKLCTYKLKSLPNYVDDCVQDVFLDLSDAINKGKVIEYPKAWLTKVANNKIKDIYNQAKRDAEKIVPLESQNLDNTYSGVVYDEYFSIEDENTPSTANGFRSYETKSIPFLQKYIFPLRTDFPKLKFPFAL